MTSIIEVYHTHADGSEKGWFGEVTHPAHLREDREGLLPDTAFTLRREGQELSALRFKLIRLARQHNLYRMLHPKQALYE